MAKAIESAKNGKTVSVVDGVLLIVIGGLPSVLLHLRISRDWQLRRRLVVDHLKGGDGQGERGCVLAVPPSSYDLQIIIL
jgi:hypothetical protein